MYSDMRSYYFILLACLLVPTLLADGTPGLEISSCDQTMINKIEAFWGGADTPKNVLKLIEDSGEFTIVMKSFKFLGRENKCIHINVSAEQKVFTVLSTPVHDNHTVVSRDYHLDQYDGFVLEKKWGFHAYYILIRSNVLVTYICTTKEGRIGPINGYIAVANRKWKDSCTQAAFKTARGLMEMMGFDFIYQYGDECFD